ncbi:hypothetical protein HBH85_240010 [Parastagonospora nodorum]|nr:hypothetical protein HBH85_240010 [Parastagonospora nodorum]
MLRTILTSTYLSRRRLEAERLLKRLQFSSYAVKEPLYTPYAENLACYNSAVDSNDSSNAAYISICYNYSTKAITTKRKTY